MSLITFEWANELHASMENAQRRKTRQGIRKLRDNIRNDDEILNNPDRLVDTLYEAKNFNVDHTSV